MDKLLFKLQNFEGPLDLLLFLITKNKLNIYDIPISELLSQYLEFIKLMKDKDMELASEFLEMAARLVYIKTLTLLPKYEEADVLRRELTGELIEYEACKAAATKLSEKVNYNIFVRNQIDIPTDKTYKLFHSPMDLLSAYIDAVGKTKRRLPPPQSAFNGIVSRKLISVSSRILYILRSLATNKKKKYQELFLGDRPQMVATFLAVLELVKAKRILLTNNTSHNDDYIITICNGGERQWKSKRLKNQ
jgi:segregation and condensation protein A